jgi:hypothetical protein
MSALDLDHLLTVADWDKPITINILPKDISIIYYYGIVIGLSQSATVNKWSKSKADIKSYGHKY